MNTSERDSKWHLFTAAKGGVVLVQRQKASTEQANHQQQKLDRQDQQLNCQKRTADH